MTVIQVWHPLQDTHCSLQCSPRMNLRAPESTTSTPHRPTYRSLHHHPSQPRLNPLERLANPHLTHVLHCFCFIIRIPSQHEPKHNFNLSTVPVLNPKDKRLPVRRCQESQWPRPLTHRLWHRSSVKVKGPARCLAHLIRCLQSPVSGRLHSGIARIIDRI
jgi:hypothetical protein